MPTTKHLLVRGRLRDTRMAEALAAEATAMGLAGWVRARSDGSIEAMVQGEADFVGMLVDWATRGTSDALVSAVEISDGSGSFQGFQQLAVTPPEPTVTRQITVHGRVQGVGFRDALRAQAWASGVAGWVRNRIDGTVEAVLHGTEDSVQAVIAWARRGPPAARVTRVEVSEAEGEFQGFDRLPSA